MSLLKRIGAVLGALGLASVIVALLGAIWLPHNIIWQRVGATGFIVLCLGVAALAWSTKPV